MSNLTDFFPSGGGGLTPKFQEFNASGTFTPTQALIDAGGYIEIFLVAGGGGGVSQDSDGNGGQGGEAKFKNMYLNSTNSINVTIGSGGPVDSGFGGNSLFSGSTAGGIDVTSNGGRFGGSGYETWTGARTISPSWGSAYSSSTRTAAPSPGVFGYGMGGGSDNAATGAVTTNGPLPNSGQGGSSATNAGRYSSGGSGYCLIKWYE
jgi:hypothetical protein